MQYLLKTVDLKKNTHTMPRDNQFYIHFIFIVTFSQFLLFFNFYRYHHSF